MKLDELIHIADEAYGIDGLVKQYYKNPFGEYGDTFAKFIAIELQETYEEDKTTAEQLEEAERVMNVVCNQVHDVLAGLQSKNKQEKS